MTPDLERALQAQAETGDAVTIDLESGTFQISPRSTPWREPERQEPARRTPMELVVDMLLGTRV